MHNVHKFVTFNINLLLLAILCSHGSLQNFSISMFVTFNLVKHLFICILNMHSTFTTLTNLLILFFYQLQYIIIITYHMFVNNESIISSLETITPTNDNCSCNDINLLMCFVIFSLLSFLLSKVHLLNI